MGRRRWIILAWGALCSQPLTAVAQQYVAPPTDLSGQNSSDLVAVSPGVPTVPLRHGGVVPQSERVLMNGTLLQSGVDYSMDYGSGMVYLMRAVPSGQTLNVSYRYSKTGSSASTGFGNGINSFQFGLLPGALNMRLGFGLAERGNDGTVMRSNLFGLNTNYKLGMASNINGLVLFGDRQQVTSTSNFEMNQQRGAALQNKSRLVLEDISTKLMGGTLNLDYQDVSKSFTGFAAAQGSGFDQKQIDQLQKEKGLTRQGFGMTDLGLGGLKISDSFHEIRDANSMISSKSFGLKEGALTFDWNTQNVGQGFTRFNDLEEANHADLLREQGTKRDNEMLGLNLKGGTLSASEFDVTDQGGGQLKRHDVALKLKNGSAAYGDSSVQSQFTGFGNLLDPEKKTYSLDAGLHRQWESASFDFGHGDKEAFSESSIRSATGSFHAEDLSLAASKWNFGYSDRDTDSTFASFGSLNAADSASHINAIGAMYGVAKPNVGAETPAFALTPGLDRKDYTLGLSPAKNVLLTGNDLTLQGLTDSTVVDSLGIKAGGLTGTYKYENVGANFAEITNLMGFEKGIIGPLEGLKKTDLALADNLGHGRSFSFSDMVADTSTGGSGHQQFEYNDRQLDITHFSMSVDPTFATVGQLVDPLAGTMAAEIGYKQGENKIAWAPGSGLKYTGDYSSTSDATTGVDTASKSTNIAFARGRTAFSYIQNDQHSNDPLNLILENDQQTLSFKQGVGNWTIHTQRDTVDLGGKTEVDSSGNPLQSYVSNTIGVDLKVSKTTSLASELVSTEFANGEKASQRTDSVSTAITPRAGITLSNTQIDNHSDQQIDETKRNYGFWYDVAKNLRVSYGYIRDLNAGDVSGAGTLNSLLTVGSAPAGVGGDSLAKVNQGTLGDLNLGGGYAANQWATPNPTTGLGATRTQSFSNVRISTVKPLSAGPISELKLLVNSDTAADNFAFIRQNQEYGINGKVGTAGFGFDYHGQIDSQGEHAEDRAYSFTTDPAERHLITGSVLYKIRTMPAAQDAMIRNFDLKLHATNRLTISNQLQTNPEVANANVILGSVAQGTQVNRYKAEYKSTKDVSFGASWEESKNSTTNTYGQTTGANLSLFNSKSPLILSYGFQALNGNVPRQTIQRWSVKFDQQAGPNQSFNFLIGSLNYGYLTPTGQAVHSLTAQLGYQLRF